MASINGVSIKKLKVTKVDFNEFPYAETGAIASGDVYYKGEFITHFAEDINGGAMNYSSQGRRYREDELDEPYYRWKSGIREKEFATFDCFLYDIIGLTDLENAFKKESKKGECTLFGALGLSGYGTIKGYIEKGNKNLTAAKKEQLEKEVQKEFTGMGGLGLKDVYVKAFRKASDFDIFVGEEKDGKALYKAEMDKKRKEKEAAELEAKKRKEAERKSRFQITNDNGNSSVITDTKTGKTAKVSLYAQKETLRVLRDLFE